MEWRIEFTDGETARVFEPSLGVKYSVVENPQMLTVHEKVYENNHWFLTSTHYPYHRIKSMTVTGETQMPH